jgi:peptidoglycan/LPS O-acetylase OafA/YrhL
MASMEDENKSYDGKVIWTHSVIMVFTVVVPMLLLMLKIISIGQCFALFGTGFFILSGHTLAFFESYVDYFEKLDTMQLFEETTVRKLLRFGIGLDLMIAVFFYLSGIK